MSPKKSNYPYYAKWWFFIGMIFLSWITPITSNWNTYFFGEQIEAHLARIYDEDLGRIVRKYVFKYEGYPYFSKYKEVINHKNMPVTVELYFKEDNPNENFIGILEYIYFGKRLIFPILFQMLMISFFFLVRTKEYNT